MDLNEIHNIIETDISNSKKSIQIYYKLVEFYKHKYTCKGVAYIEDVCSICCDIIETLLNENLNEHKQLINKIIMIHEKWFQ